MEREVAIVSERYVSCDGGTGALGHPKIYIRIGASNEAECPYCSKTFIYETNNQ